jgi:hypothetical protein
VADAVASEVNLQDLVHRIPGWARERELVPLAAVPEPCEPFVQVEDATTAEEFLDLARAGRARFVYYTGREFDADEFDGLDADDDEDMGIVPASELEEVLGDVSRQLSREAQAHRGEVCAAGMCFVTAGVSHYWLLQAPWYLELKVRQEELTERGASERERISEEMQAHRNAEVERIAEELQTRADFRRVYQKVSLCDDIARQAYPVEEAADEDAVEDHERTISRAVSRARETVEQEAHRIFTAMENELDELAEDVVATAVLAGATTVSVRTIKIQDFLTQRTGGYPPPRRTVELLMAKPQLKATRQRQSTLALTQNTLV